MYPGYAGKNTVKYHSILLGIVVLYKYILITYISNRCPKYNLSLLCTSVIK